MPTPIRPREARGLSIALIHALVAENLALHYEHGQWLTPAQGAGLAAQWLSRNQGQMAQADRLALANIGNGIARQIAGTLSREAGLFVSHELAESLDPRYHSEISQQIMAECEHQFSLHIECEQDIPPTPAT